MINKIEKPIWYDDAYYNKKRTPEEWLYEIYKRDRFERDDVLSFSTRLLLTEEKIQCFLEIIFLDKIEDFLSGLEATPPQPIKHLSVSDVFRMMSLIRNSEWYKNHPDKMMFENADTALTAGKSLLLEEKKAFNEFFNAPWHSFHENSNEKDWYPNKDITHLSGIPISLDPSYSKEDIKKQLSTYLTRWVGKLQDIELHFDRWHESKILAVFDLMLWFRIQNLEYTNISLHRLIWPQGRFSDSENEFVNPDDDIKHSINLMQKVINKNVVRSLSIMCEARKFKKHTEDV